MGGTVKEIYKNGKTSKNLTVDELVKRINKECETEKPVIFSFGHSKRIIRKAICNGRVDK